MEIRDKTIFITGANRGIGLALLEEALRKGVKLIYAASRNQFNYPDKRVVPVILDVTNRAQVIEAVDRIPELDILINNAGIALYDDLSDPGAIEKSLAVNLFGTHSVTQAFIPLLAASKGAIVNNLSVLALAPLPLIASYCISKAAAFSLTQSLRAILASKGIRVHAVLIGPTDTDMNKGLDIPKASARETASGILLGIENNEEEIFPDPISASLAEGWRNSVAKSMEKQNATFVAA